MKHTRILVVILALQLVTLAGQWLGNPSYLTSASAQMADPARDRQQTIDELRVMNQKLEKLVEILSSGELQVRVVQPDENKAARTAR